MIIKGHMFAFGKQGITIGDMNAVDANIPRPIEIPDECVELMDRLTAAFKYGQNDFQPRAGFYSISVNDVIEIEGKYYIVRCCGFDELTPEEFEEHRLSAGKLGQFDGPTQGEL